LLALAHWEKVIINVSGRTGAQHTDAEVAHEISLMFKINQASIEKKRDLGCDFSQFDRESVCKERQS
jgi:hypothetical protein